MGQAGSLPPAITGSFSVLVWIRINYLLSSLRHIFLRGTGPFRGRHPGMSRPWTRGDAEQIYSVVKLGWPEATPKNENGWPGICSATRTRSSKLFNFQRSMSHCCRHLTMRTAGFGTAPRILFSRQRSGRFPFAILWYPAGLHGFWPCLDLTMKPLAFWLAGRRD